MQCPLLTLQFQQIGWVSVPKHRAFAVGVLCQYSLDFATMLLQAQLVTEDGMEFRWHKAILGEFCSTLGHSLKPESIKTACQLKVLHLSREICSSWRSPKSKIDSGFDAYTYLSVFCFNNLALRQKPSTMTRNS